MDDPALSDQEHQQALRGLQRVNFITGTTGRMWKHLQPLFQRAGNKPLRVMDVGCGDGLLLLQLAVRARQHGLSLQPIGCDFSERALELTRRAADSDDIAIELHQVDITQQALPTSADVVLCSLFLHHFTDTEAVAILEKFTAASRQLCLVDDLLRSQLGYYMCWVGIHLLSRSRVVHVDGLLSVRAAFSIDEVERMAVQAQLGRMRIRRHWPERFLLEWTPDVSRQHV